MHTPSAELIVEHFPVGPLGCNCVVVGNPSTGEALVVDPGGDAPAVGAALAKHGLRCTAILHTHTHFDHVAGTADLQQDLDAPVMLHESDLPLYQALQMQLDAFGVPWRAPQMPEVDRFLRHGEVLHCGDTAVAVAHTPGHTPGSLCFSFRGAEPVVLAGDTLFRGSVGRTDLWGGDGKALRHSLRSHLLSLDDETLVIPGHGPATRIGIERRTNPFIHG